jgi:hypothetical protein
MLELLIGIVHVLLVAVEDVITDRTGEEERFLEDESDFL